MVANSQDVDWDDVSHVISSQYRKTVLRQLAVGPATPSQIDNETGVSISHVSRALGELRERELVELLVSEDRRKGRVYGITEQGADLWEMVKEMDDVNEDKELIPDGGVDISKRSHIGLRGATAHLILFTVAALNYVGWVVGVLDFETAIMSIAILGAGLAAGEGVRR